MDTQKRGKRHVAHLSPYPEELLHFLPLDGPDTQYGQIYSPITTDAYANTGIKGFQPRQPHVVSANSAFPSASEDITFPSLAELNADCFEWDKGEEDVITDDHSLCADAEICASVPTPRPPAQAPPTPLVPAIGPPTARILVSTDNFF